MQSIIVRDGFYNSLIVQNLRLLYSEDIKLVNSNKIISDLVFPFYDDLSFAIFYPDNLNKDGVERVIKLTEICNNLVLIICISLDESMIYENFIHQIPQTVTAVVCFPHEEFQKLASTYIYDSTTNFMKNKRDLNKTLESKRKSDVDPDIQSKKIFTDLIKPNEVKNKILKMMEKETGTIRKTMIEGLPELFKYDFYMEIEPD